MSLRITLNPNIKLEFAFGTVTKGKEAQLFGEYFSVINPVLAEHGANTAASFAVIDTNWQGVTPVMGALTFWPSLENRKNFHEDERFLSVKQLRDDAMDLLCGGHMFISSDKEVNLNTDSDYALILSDENVQGLEPLFNLPFISDSPQKDYIGKSLALYAWNEVTEQLLTSVASSCEVFKVRFNVPNS